VDVPRSGKGRILLATATWSSLSGGADMGNQAAP
jgi:hypothetical protein